LAEILSRREYTGGDWLERGIRFIGEYLEGMGDVPSLSFPGWEIPMWLFPGRELSLWLLPVILFLLLALCLLWIRGHLAPDRQLKKKRGGNLPGKPVNREKELKALSEQAARRGDFRLAIRYLFQAVLAALRDQGILSEVSHRTHREQIAEIRSRMPERCPLFESLVFRFEEAWYGQVPVGPGEYHRFREEADKHLKGDPAHATTG
jgi:hypothetical protein